MVLTFLHITSRRQKNGSFLLKCRKQENIFRNFAIMRMEKEIALLWYLLRNQFNTQRLAHSVSRFFMPL